MPMAPSRRQFIAGATALLASAGCATNVAGVPVPAGRWAELAHRLTGRLVRPGDADYAALALPNNLRYASRLPAGIALCADARDVSASILWAREYGVAFAARSGGHSYGGYSTSSGLLIDVRTMNGLRYDPASGVATLGGGARNANVYAGLRPYGVAVTHGRCYKVGVAGLVLGGGIGFNMRANGVTSDQLIGTEIVTADGTIRTLDAKHDPDLFWACRGAGGGNFGIHTSFRFQTFAVDRVTVFDLTWSQRPDEVFAALLRALDAAPDALGCKVALSAPTQAQRARGLGLTVQLLGQLRGRPRDLAEILAPVYRIARPSGTIRETAYWPGQDFLSEEGLPEYFHEPSRFFNTAISDEAIGAILDGMRRWPGTTEAAAFKLFQTGGAMNAVAPGATAFVHRESRWLSSIGLVWSEHDARADVQRNLAWQERFYADYAAYAGGGAYQNFIDPTLRDWKRAYYASNLARLEAVKARVDPDGVFRFPEGIPAS
jgi:FAD/FMN-containing dehydrogenase